VFLYKASASNRSKPLKLARSHRTALHSRQAIWRRSSTAGIDKWCLLRGAATGTGTASGRLLRSLIAAAALEGAVFAAAACADCRQPNLRDPVRADCIIATPGHPTRGLRCGIRSKPARSRRIANQRDWMTNVCSRGTQPEAHVGNRIPPIYKRRGPRNTRSPASNKPKSRRNEPRGPSHKRNAQVTNGMPQVTPPIPQVAT
jgi:hypothetical protein